VFICNYFGTDLTIALPVSVYLVGCLLVAHVFIINIQLLATAFAGKLNHRSAS